MNKSIKKGILGICSLLLLSGCGEKTIPKLDNGQDAVVTIQEDTKISVNDLYNAMKDTYGLNELITLIDRIILEKEFPNDLEDAKESAKTTMEQLEAAYGDDLLGTIQAYTGFSTLEEYEDYLYISNLENKVLTNYAKEQISEKDIKKYYDDEIKGDIKVSHILFSVNYSDDATDEEKDKAKEEARNKAQEVLDMLKETSKDEIPTKFSELAKEYSDDDSTKEDGGNLGFINTGTLGSNYTELTDEAYKLKDGEYSGIVESELGYHIVLRTESKEKASLDDVRDTIIDDLVAEYTSEHQEAYIKSMQELRQKYDVNIVDDDLNQKYKEYIQNALLELQANNNSSNN